MIEKDKKEIYIEILFNDFCNLYGDVGNIMYFEKSKKYLKDNYNIQLNIIYTGLNDEISFVKRDDISLVYMGSFSEKYRDRIIKKLNENKEEIFAKIRNGQNMLVTGNGFDIFGKYIILDRRYEKHNYITCKENIKTIDYYNVEKIEDIKIREKDIEKIDGKYIVKALGLYDTVAVEEMLLRHNTFTLAEYDDIKIIGFKNTFTQSYELIKEDKDKENEEKKQKDNNIQYFAKVIRGSGISDENKYEGIMINNFIATYILGPILINNPYLTKKIFKDIFGIENILLEEELINLYNIRLKEFEDEKRNLGKWR